MFLWLCCMLTQIWHVQGRSMLLIYDLQRFYYNLNLFVLFLFMCLILYCPIMVWGSVWMIETKVIKWWHDRLNCEIYKIYSILSLIKKQKPEIFRLGQYVKVLNYIILHFEMTDCLIHYLLFCRNWNLKFLYQLCYIFSSTNIF